MTVEADSSAPTNAVAEPESAAPLSCLPHNPKLPLHHETKGQRAHLTTSRRPRTPVQGIHTGSGTPSRRGRAREDVTPCRRRRLDVDAGNLTLETLGLKLLPTPPPPAARRPMVSTASRRPGDHRRRERPPAPPAGTLALPVASFNCSKEERGRVERGWSHWARSSLLLGESKRDGEDHSWMETMRMRIYFWYFYNITPSYFVK